MVATCLMPVLLIAAPQAAAHDGHNGSYTYRDCKVTMRMPSATFTDAYGGTWVNGKALASTSNCGKRHTITICHDYKYRRNNGKWYGWRNSSPSDNWRFARNGCLNSVGSTGSSDAFASLNFAHMAYEYGLYDADCADFKAVTRRTSSWVQTENGRSAVHRSDLKITSYC